MTPEAIEQAAELLFRARCDRAPFDRLPDSCRPQNFDDGYRVQEALVAKLAAHLDGARQGAAAAGFKIGATSEKAQRLLGLLSPFYGRILASGAQQSPAEISTAGFNFLLVEPEFAFQMGADLPGREAPYSEDEVAEAVAALLPAVEIVTSAFGVSWTRVGGTALAADNGAHAAFVKGQAHSDWRHLDLAGHAVTLRLNGKTIGAGTGANALGGPLTALTWLANELGTRAQGPRLKAGDFVSTGVVTDFVLVEAGDEILAEFGELGQVAVRFGP